MLFLEYVNICIYFLLLQDNMFSNTITINIIDIKCFKYLKKGKIKKYPLEARFYWVGFFRQVFNTNPE